MSSHKFCANLNFLFKKESDSLLQRYEAAAASGFKGVETGNVYEVPLGTLKGKKEELGLEQILINSHPGIQPGDFGLAAIPGREADFLESFKISVEYAQGLECKMIHIMSGRNIGFENSRKVLQTLESNLLAIESQLKELGIVGTIEPINNYTIPGYLLSDYDEALKIIKRINSPNIRLQLDFFHLQQICGNISKNVKMLLPYTGHIQIAQVPLRNEPHLTGELDFGYILNLLKEEKYEGWIGLEYESDKCFKTTAEGLKEFLNQFSCSL